MSNTCVKIVNRPLTQDEINLVLLKCLGHDAGGQSNGFYVPSHLIMHITQQFSPASWEAVYIQESVHSIVSDCWLGWTIQALEDLSNNLFIAMKNETGKQQELTSWIMNIEHKKYKLLETWRQTQEGTSLYFLLDFLDLEERSITTTKSLCKIKGETLRKEVESRIRQEAKLLRTEIAESLKSKRCRDYYWKGYEKILQISKMFGQEFVAPSVLAASSVKLPLNFLEKTPAEFDEMVKNLRYNADKRLELITQISLNEAVEKEKKDQLSFLNFLLNHFNEKIDVDVDLYGYVGKLFSHICLPKAFRKKFLPAFFAQKERAETRWKCLKEKGYDPSQIISLINTVGKTMAISNFEPVSTPETAEISEVTYDQLFASLEKCSFVFECIVELDKKKKVEEWMRSIAGFSGLDVIKKMLPESLLLSKAKICPICSADINYKNYLFECPYSKIFCCVKCCKALPCENKCNAFKEADKKVVKINKMIKKFRYNLKAQNC